MAATDHRLASTAPDTLARRDEQVLASRSVCRTRSRAMFKGAICGVLGSPRMIGGRPFSTVFGAAPSCNDKVTRSRSRPCTRNCLGSGRRRSPCPRCGSTATSSPEVSTAGGGQQTEPCPTSRPYRVRNFREPGGTPGRSANRKPSATPVTLLATNVGGTMHTETPLCLVQPPGREDVVPEAAHLRLQTFGIPV